MRARKLPKHFGTGLILAGLALFLGSCSANDVTGSTTPTTDTFTGTLFPNGSDTYALTVKGPGEVDASLASLTPQSTITVGLAIGQPIDGTCVIITGVENAKTGQTLPAPAAEGTYCVVIYDVGNVQGSDAFVLNVTHP